MRCDVPAGSPSARMALRRSARTMRRRLAVMSQVRSSVQPRKPGRSGLFSHDREARGFSLAVHRETHAPRDRRCALNAKTGTRDRDVSCNAQHDQGSRVATRARGREHETVSAPGVRSRSRAGGVSTDGETRRRTKSRGADRPDAGSDPDLPIGWAAGYLGAGMRPRSIMLFAMSTMVSRTGRGVQPSIRAAFSCETVSFLPTYCRTRRTLLSKRATSHISA